jgi:hypothetical protein
MVASGSLAGGVVSVTLAERPDLAGAFDALSHAPWPEFMHHAVVDGGVWRSLNTRFAAFQVALLDAAGELLAVGRTIPLVWDGTAGDLPEDYPAILTRAEYDADAGCTPNTVSALLASVAAEHRGSGLSRLVVGAMRDAAVRHGATTLIAPVRPTWKTRYPLTPIERYVRWTHPGTAGDASGDGGNGREGGAPFDPWLRVHWRLGAEVIAVDPDHFVVRGSVAEWESWVGMAFPESGRYVVPEALAPVEIDRERDTGIYEEPCVWMCHRL